MMAIRPGILLFALLAAAPAGAQDTRDQTTMDKAKDIALQPAEDIGIKKTEIPPVLVNAVAAPYAMPAKGCKTVQTSLSELNEALGPDLDSTPAEKADTAGRLAQAGGQAVVNSLIPFRGLVREISGAAPAERRLQDAVDAGLARRGFLRGLAASRGCKIPAYVPASASKG